MSVNQISAFLENRPGTMREFTQVLAENRIDMNAFFLVEADAFGIARLIVDDVEKTTEILRDAGYICSLTPVVAVSIPDEPGGLDQVLEVLQKAGVNIEYMYAFLGGPNVDHAYMVFRVEDEAAAEKALVDAGIRIVDQNEISEL